MTNVDCTIAKYWAIDWITHLLYFNKPLTLVIWALLIVVIRTLFAYIPQQWKPQYTALWCWLIFKKPRLKGGRFKPFPFYILNIAAHAAVPFLVFNYDSHIFQKGRLHTPLIAVSRELLTWSSSITSFNGSSLVPLKCQPKVAKLYDHFNVGYSILEVLNRIAANSSPGIQTRNFLCPVLMMGIKPGLSTREVQYILYHCAAAPTLLPGITCWAILHLSH